MKQVGENIKEIFKNARGIYIRDMKGILHDPVAAIVVLGLIVLPSLYAWVNIIACWDPYGNTSGINVAVVNLDQGVELNGEYINAGDSIVGNLRENHSIGWQFVDMDDAEYGLTHSRYYAMLEIPENFSAQLVDVLNGDLKKPEIIYRVNEKSNAIAPKITDTGAKTVTNQVTQSIIEVVDQAAFSVGNEVGDTMDSNKDKITQLRDIIVAVNQNFNDIEAGMTDAQQGLITVNELLLAVSDSLPSIKNGMADLEDFSARGNEMLNEAEAIKIQSVDYLDGKFEEVLALNDQLQSFVGEAQSETADIQKLQDKIPDIQEVAGKLQGALGEFIAILGKYEDKGVDYDKIITQMEQADQVLAQMSQALEVIKNDPEEVKRVLLLAYTTSGKAIDNQLKNLEDISTAAQEDLSITLPAVLDMIEQSAQNGISGDIDHEMLIQELTNEQRQLLPYRAKYPQMSIDALYDDLSMALQSAQAGDDSAALLGYLNTTVADSAVIRSEIPDQQLRTDAEIATAQAKLQEAQRVNQDNLIRVEAMTPEEIAANFQQLQDELTNLQGMVSEAEGLVKKLQDKGITVGAIISELQVIDHELSNARSMLTRLDGTMTDGLQLADEAIALVQTTGQEVEKAIADMRGAYNERWDAAVEGMLGDLKGSLNELDHVLVNANDALPKLDELMIQGTEASEKSQQLLDEVNVKLPQARADIAKASSAMSKLTDENLEFLIGVLGSDADAMSDYFSGPVELKEERLYHLDNYGSAMTPFYTVLALWVGCLLLSAMLTVEAEPLVVGQKLRMVEIYFGKMMTFMTLTLLQSLVVALGDKYLLGVTVTNLPLFIAFCLFTSVVFTLIVYTIVSLLETIGKAICVVLLVLQLAGAGGTFPVEVMPMFYQVMQPYLPFTYAIGALREAISGPMLDNVLLDFGMLCLFGAIGLLLGLTLKKPLHPLISWFMRKFKESSISE